MHLLVVAKEPVPGRVKTRLCPPCSPVQAAHVAEAALADTLAAAVASGADRVVLVLDGAPGPWCPSGVRVVPQGRGDLPARLARAWAAVPGPALQIGMDTPQVGPADLDAAMAALGDGCGDAVLGPALDGGWWAIGLRWPVPGVFDGVPMSTAHTYRDQRRRLRALGLRVATLSRRRDVDTWADALAVAAAVPASRFANAVASVRHGVPADVAVR